MKIKNSGKKVLVVEFEGMGYENNIDIFMGSEEAIKNAPAWDALDEQGERIYEDYAEYTDVLHELGLTYVDIGRHDLV